MKTSEAEFNCKRCKNSVRFSFVKPNRIQSTKTSTFCKSCGTDYDLTIKIQKGTDGKGLDAELAYKMPKPQEEAAEA